MSRGDISSEVAQEVMKMMFAIVKGIFEVIKQIFNARK
jgi:hypothetical protein